MSDDPDADLRHRVREAIAGVLAGSEYCPEEGAVLVDAVVVCGWFTASGDHGTSMVRCGAPWSTRGLVAYAVDLTDGDNEIEWELEDDDE